MNEPQAHKGRALIAGVVAYLVWGVVGWYFHALAPIPPLTILAHRVVWSLVFCCGVLWCITPGSDFRRAVRNIQWAHARKLTVILFFSSVAIAINWVTFIEAAAHDKLMAASLGYFLAPLMNVIMGVTLLRERLRALQSIAIGLAGLAVTALVILSPSGLWITTAIVISWSFYAYLRKIAHVGPIVGLTIETALLTPVAIGYLVWQMGFSADAVPYTPIKYGMLMLAGIITAIPLILFAYAARRLLLATIGLLQFIAPSVQFVVALLLPHDPLDARKLACFCVIWASLVIYSIDSYRAARAWVAPPAD